MEEDIGNIIVDGNSDLVADSPFTINRPDQGSPLTKKAGLNAIDFFFDAKIQSGFMHWE